MNNAKAACALALVALLALAPLAHAAESVPIPGGWDERGMAPTASLSKQGARRFDDAVAHASPPRLLPPALRSQRQLQPHVLEEAR